MSKNKSKITPEAIAQKLAVLEAAVTAVNEKMAEEIMETKNQFNWPGKEAYCPGGSVILKSCVYQNDYQGIKQNTEIWDTECHNHGDHLLDRVLMGYFDDWGWQTVDCNCNYNCKR